LRRGMAMLAKLTIKLRDGLGLRVGSRLGVRVGLRVGFIVGELFVFFMGITNKPT